MSKISISVLAAALAASSAFAQARGPVVPNFQQPEKQAAAPAAPAPAADIDLVGPTAAQQARAKAAAEAKAKADADAKAASEQKARDEAAARLRAQADAMARSDAEAKAKADAEAKARADAAEQARLSVEARQKSEAQAKADARAAKLRAVEESKARARAAVEAAKQKALEAELARRRAVEVAKAAARAAVEAKKRAADEAAGEAREEAKARKAEAEAKAKAKALVIARKRDEAKCKGKKAAKCLAAVAAKYDAPTLPAAEPLALAPLIATPPAAAAPAPVVVAPAPVAAAPAPVVAAVATAPRAVAVPNAPLPPAVVVPPPAAPAPARAAIATPPGTRVASVTLPPAPQASRAQVLAIPRDEQPRKSRAAEVVNDLQLGPQSLILDNLAARGDIVPGLLQLDFGYRFAIDDAAAPHHLFLAGLESGRCPAGDACGLRWFLRGGLGPHAAGDFTVDRRINGALAPHRDSLGWSASVLQAGFGWTASSVSVLADAQLEGLTEEYLRNVDLSGPQRVSGTLQQLRLRATAGVQSGAFSAQARLAKYSYSGDPADSFKDVPMRGALIEDDMPGLAGALQSASARLEARLETQGGTAVSATYGYLSYAGPVWSGAHIFAGAVSQKLGRFRVGLGIVAEQESDVKGNSYPTVFGTGTVGASF